MGYLDHGILAGVPCFTSRRIEDYRDTETRVTSYMFGTQKAHKHEHFYRDIPTLLGFMIRDSFYGISLSLFLLMCFFWGPTYMFGFRDQGWELFVGSLWGYRNFAMGGGSGPGIRFNIPASRNGRHQIPQNPCTVSLKPYILYIVN